MLHKAVKVRLYPTLEQEVMLAQHFGCARWWWNFALNKSIETYRETGKGLGRSALNALLPKLKKDDETRWLGECYSQVLQAVTLNLTTAYKNFFDGRARFPRFKSKHGRQSIQYPQSVKVENSAVKLPGKIGTVKAKIHRLIEGKIKSVTVSLELSGKYYASILTELTEIEGDNPAPSLRDACSLSLRPLSLTRTTEGRVIGVDLGLKHFAVVSDGNKVSKYDNPRHLAKHEKNLKRKQQKLLRKQTGSNSRNKYRKVVARVYERVCNSRSDFLHKLSRKLVNENQVIVVENLHAKGMVTLVPVRVASRSACAKHGALAAKPLPKAREDSLTLRYRDRNLDRAISDVGWEIFINFLAYKLEKKGGKLVEIDRWFPISNLCSSCYHQVDEMSLAVREWTCPHCKTHHERDENAATNIRAEGIRMLKADGTSVSAVGGEVRPKAGRKSVLRHSLASTEAPGAALLRNPE